ncbi:MAG: MFS transporter [Janthinobacterium lividum]
MSFDASRARVATTLVFLLNGCVLGVWATEVAPLRERLGLSPGVLGGVLLCGAAGALVAMPLSGRLIARFGAGQVIQAGAVVACAALAGAVSAPGVWALCLCLLGFGAGFGTVDVAMNAEAVRVEQRAGRPILSSVHGMWSLGSFCGSAGGAALLRVATPAVQAGLVAGGCCAALLGAGAMLRRRGAAEVAEDGPAAGVARPGGGRLWARRGLLLAGAMMALSFAVEGAVLDWGGVYLREARHVPVALAAAGFSAFSATMMAMRFGGDRVRARLGDRWVLRASLGATAGFALLLWPGPLWLSLLGFALAGAGVANVVPVLFALAGAQGGAQGGSGRASGPGPADAARRTGEAVGVASVMGYAGVLGGPPMFGMIAQASSVGVALGIAGALCAAVALAGGLAVRLRGR